MPKVLITLSSGLLDALDAQAAPNRSGLVERLCWRALGAEPPSVLSERVSGSAALRSARKIAAAPQRGRSGLLGMIHGIQVGPGARLKQR